MAERYAHHHTGGISRPHQPATCRGAVAVSHGLRSRLHAGASDTYRHDRRRLACAVGSTSVMAPPARGRNVCASLGPERATYASPGQTQRRSRKCSPGCNEAPSRWPSVTRTITPAAFRGHINPQPAAERLRCRTDCDRGCTPVRGICIGAIAGDWPVRLVAHQLWLHRRGAGMSAHHWALKGPPMPALDKRSGAAASAVQGAMKRIQMAERYAHHHTGGISRPHQPATCRGAVAVSHGLRSRLHAGAWDMYRRDRRRLACAVGSTSVMAPPARGRNVCASLGPERATYASPGQTQRRSRKCSPGCNEAHPDGRALRAPSHRRHFEATSTRNLPRSGCGVARIAIAVARRCVGYVSARSPAIGLCGW